MINGIPLKSLVRGDNHVAWGEYPINSISRIEVIRGPGSALYGADAFAGVINIITKSGTGNEQEEIGGSIGSFNSQSTWVNKKHNGESYDLAFSLEYSRSDGHKEIIKQDAQYPIDVIANQMFGLPPASLAPGPVNVGFKALDVFINGSIDKFELNLGLQERTDLGTGQGVGFALDPSGKVGGQKFIFDLSYNTGELASGWLIISKLSYYRSKQTIEEDLNVFPPGAFFGRFPQGFIGNPEWKEDNTTLTIKAEYNHFSKHQTSIGLGYSNAELFEVTEHKNFFPDLTPRPNGVEDVSDTPEIFIPEASRNSRYVYLQDIWQIAPDWQLTSGLRWDQYSDIGSTVNPRFALVWSSSLHSTTKFLYGRAFRAPSIAELLVTNNPVALGNPNLSPEIIETYEIGYSLNVSEPVSLSLNVFYYQIEDFITFSPDEITSTSTAQNVGKREGYGFELESSIDLSKVINLKFNYSYVKATNKLLQVDVGDYPNHQFNTDFNWNITNQWALNFNANIVGERLRTFGDQRSPLKGYANLSSNLTYFGLGQGFEVSISGKNLLDDDIFETSPGPDSATNTISIPHDLPQAGRSIFLIFTKNF
jgi:iron complex outermembrane receptor protein